jgi:hypothetical protein
MYTLNHSPYIRFDLSGSKKQLYRYFTQFGWEKWKLRSNQQIIQKILHGQRWGSSPCKFFWNKTNQIKFVRLASGGEAARLYSDKKGLIYHITIRRSRVQFGQKRSYLSSSKIIAYATNNDTILQFSLQTNMTIIIWIQFRQKRSYWSAFGGMGITIYRIIKVQFNSRSIRTLILRIEFGQKRSILPE